MSLVSASGLIGGLKEYAYRGIQQLPIVLGTTSLIFAITTGSIVHFNLALGLGVLMPLYTWILNVLLGALLEAFALSHKVSWTRSTGDTCNLIPNYGQPPLIGTYVKQSGYGESVPSYWLMSIAFFIGYSITNAIDNLLTPAQPSSDEAGVEQRNTKSVFVIVATVLFAFSMLFVRFKLMSGCEGRGLLGICLSLISAVGAASIGYGIYNISKLCGARSSDLFGILSQILPPSATTVNPIVCSSD